MSIIAMDANVQQLRVRGAAAGHRHCAHPPRAVRGVVSGRTAACAVTRPLRPAYAPLWRSLRVAAVSVLAVVGGIVGVTGYVAAVTQGPADVPVAGSAAWAHVEP